MLKRRPWVPVALSVALAAPAAGQTTVDGETTDPLTTSTAGDVSITPSGTVTITEGAAVTVDSANSVENDGTIQSTDADDTIGVRGLGGPDRSILNQGSISLVEDFENEDVDDDGDLDGPFATGSGRVGILIEGDDPFGGSIENDNGGSILVEGNDSAGIRTLAAVEGEIDNSGSITVLGDRVVGVDIGDEVGGDVRQRGTISARGEDATAVRVAGDVAGGFDNSGSLTAAGFRSTATSNYFDPDQVPDDFQPLTLDDDDLLDTGPTVEIAASIAQGFLNNGAVGGAADDDPEEGEDPEKDTRGDFDINRSTGGITVFGSAPAVLISPDGDPDGTGDLVVGLVVENVRDTTDDDDDGDTDEVLATFNEPYGFINRGSIVSNGFNVGFDSNAIVIRGSADGSRMATVEGGMFNSGSIASNGREANATTIRIGAGGALGSGADASLIRLVNEGAINASTFTETDHVATALRIDEGGLLSTVLNNSTIFASVRGDAGSAIAIVDRSGTLMTVENTGFITAAFQEDLDDDDGDGLGDDEPDPDERTGRVIAIDLSQNQMGALVRQLFATPTDDINDDGVLDTDDVFDPSLIGDVYFGSGDDTFEISAGSFIGDVFFGGGEDVMTVSGATTTATLAFLDNLVDPFDPGATAASDDGRLRLAVTGGAALNVSNVGDVRLTSFELADDSEFTFRVDLTGPQAASTRLMVEETATISANADLTPQFEGISAESFEVAIVQAGELDVQGDLADQIAPDAPFIYDVELSVSQADPNTVIVTGRRRTPDELGFNVNQAAFLENVVEAAEVDTDLANALAALVDGDDFRTAYDQLLPDFSDVSARYVLAMVDGALGAVGNRLEAVRGGREAAGGAWMQEFVTYADRSSSALGPGYRGYAFGLGAGLDRPLGPFYAVGVNVTGAAGQFEQPESVDDPLTVVSGHLGAYAAANFRRLYFDVHAGAGIDQFDRDRSVDIRRTNPDTPSGFESLYSQTASGGWTAYHFAGSARLALDMSYRRLFLRPGITTNYVSLQEEGYEETGGAAVNLVVGDRETEVFSSTAGVTIGGRFGGSGQRTWWSPRLRAAYRIEHQSTPGVSIVSFADSTMVSTLRGAELQDSGGVYGFSFAAGSRYSSFSFDYDVDQRDGFIQHVGRVTFRFLF